MADEKTEKPTEQRKRQARRDGTIARTPDLGVWAGMLVASIALPVVVKSLLHRAEALYVRGLGVISDPDPGRALQLLRAALFEGATAVAPLAVGLFATALVAAAAQGGLRPATKLFKPDFKRLNPLSGLKRMLGPQSLWEGFKALVKAVVIGLVVYYVLRGLIPALLSSAAMPLQALLATVGGALIKIMQAAAAAGLVLAAADYGMARKRVNKQLRMSKQEIKEEHKRSEGDPQLKGAIRSRQFAISRNRMMANLPNADVILVNPTHVAVALRYEPAKGAPVVIAKGAGVVAAKIREVAATHRIPLVQDVPLARSLHAGCEVGAEVPPELYGAVARVLAFVLGLKAKGSAAGLHRAPVTARAA